jgi:hypothetical protein
LEAPHHNLQTYLTLEPTVNFEKETKLQELHDLVAKQFGETAVYSLETSSSRFT